MIKKKSLNYKESGVDIDVGNKLIKQIKSITRKTNRPEIIKGIGGFSALCALPKKYHEPILVSSTDGIGTKLHLATKFKNYDTIGIDLVAMCVNDIIVYGAEPLFFLDYYATSKLNIKNIKRIISGIVEGCLQAKCTLIGGETAEIPGLYNNKDYDIAGFCVGLVEKSKIINGDKKINNGDVMIALGSSGLHSNGYSLVSKILKINNLDIQSTYLEGKLLIKHLLIPTKIYVKTILELNSNIEIHAIVHITGGGFYENIPRILPRKTQAIIYKSSWQWPIIFYWLQKKGNISNYEMYRTFNCGVGMIVILPANQAEKAIKLLKMMNENAWKIGIIKASTNFNKSVIFI